jgi:hypothetical protein
MKQCYFVITETLLEFAVLFQGGIGVQKPDVHGIVGHHGGIHPS